MGRNKKHQPKAAQQPTLFAKEENGISLLTGHAGIQPKRNEYGQQEYSLNLNQRDGIVSSPILPQTNQISPANEWVNFGIDNRYPQRLVELSFSTTHMEMLELRSSCLFGNGLVWDATNPAAGRFQMFIDGCTDPGGDDLIEMVKKWCYDYAMWNTYAFEVDYLLTKRTKETDEPLLDDNQQPIPDPKAGDVVKKMEGYISKDSIAKLRYVDPSTIRLERLDINDSVYRNVYISMDWRHWTYGGRYEPFCLPLFGVGNTCDEKEIFYYRGKVKTQNPYPLPRYAAAIMPIQSETELEELTLSTLKSRFNAALNVKVPMVLTDEGRIKWVSSFESQHKGNQTFASAYYNFAEAIDGNNNPVTTDISFLQPPFQTEAYIAAANEIDKRIMRAHGVPFALASITSGDSLGSDGKFLATMFGIWEMTQNKTARNDIISGLRKVLLFNGFAPDFVKTVQIAGFDFSEISQ